MKDFYPKKIYYEKNIENYTLGNMLLKKYSDVPKVVIDSHNNIEELRNYSNKEFGILKKYLIIGVRKSLSMQVNNKTSDYLVPFTSSGCSAMCLYCYLVCHYNKCAYLRIFVNREEIINKLIKKSLESEKDLIFEIGSNSDLILENTITHNLEYVIEAFGKINKGYITLPTKFDMVDELLNLKHKGRTIIRMSVNPQYIISNVEFGTSNLKERVNAINKLCKADYPVGIIIAPVILLDNYKELYLELIEYLNSNLSDKVKKDVFFEVIFMTYSYVHDKINLDAFPKAITIFNKNIMIGRGKGKYRYKSSVSDDAKEYIRLVLEKYFPDNQIKYIV